MPDYHIFFAVLAVSFGLYSYVPYYREVFSGTTRPHLFSWLVWTVSQGVAFFAQLVSGAGVGSLLTGLGAFLALTMTIVCLFKGEKEITRLDWISLFAAFIGIAAWILTDNPLLGVLFAATADCIGYIPTFRKTFMKPHEESLNAWMIITAAYFLNLPAIVVWNTTNLLHPALVGSVSLLLVLWIVIRRTQLKHA